ncbi:MAG: ArsR family transcriptional regulator [Methanomassiliicoccales archaeon]|nr:MAG: ArsR family transcriptional regulator [Methanomassiliicoccales archaeon]
MGKKKETDLKRRIFNSLGKLEKSVKEIAKRAELSAPTASKYLLILEAEGKAVRNEERPPYVLWSVKK